MAAHVQTKNANGTSGTATVTMSSAITAGNAIICHLFKDGDSGANTQTVGGTLTSRVSVTGSGEGSWQYTNYNWGGGDGDTITFTFTSTSWRIVVSEFSGLDTSQTTPDASNTLA